MLERFFTAWGTGEKLEEERDLEEHSPLYLSSVEGPIRRVRPLGRWEDRVREYVSEKGVRGNGLE